MTEEEKNQVLRNLPSINVDSAWYTLSAAPKRPAIQKFIFEAGDLYQLTRVVVIGGIKHTRVERRFADMLKALPWEVLEPVIKQPTKENLFPLVMLARLRGEPLPAPVDYFAP